MCGFSGCVLFWSPYRDDGGSEDPVIPPTEPPTEPPFVSPADNAVTVDGKVWLQPADFTGYIFEQVKAVCPGPDGVCSGSLQGSTFDLTGYKWASIMDVSSLFNAYGVDPPFTEPFQRRNDDSAAIAMSQDFTISGDWCFGDCPFGFDFVMGIVRDEAPTGMPPYLPYVDAGDCIEVDDVDCEFSNTTGFDSDEVKTPDDGIGVWFWKPELDTVSVNGKEWLQPKDFINYSYNQVSVACPAGVCSGTLPGSTFDLNGYTWASIDEVSALFNAYGLNPPFTAPFQERSGDKQAYVAISQDFTPTANVCYGDCPVDFVEVAGMVRDSAELGEQPYQALFRYIAPGWSPSGESVYFNNTGYTAPTPSDQVGVWFWRPELDTVSVDEKEWLQPDLFTNLSWDDINAVCPEGACAGTLNGHDMTGWTWAKVDDLNALFNHYIGSEVMGPGPEVYADEGTSGVRDFFADGWRPIEYIADYQMLTGGLRNGSAQAVQGYNAGDNEVDFFGTFGPEDSPPEDTQPEDIQDGGWFYRTL
jgi:hypothetical protein